MPRVLCESSDEDEGVVGVRNTKMMLDSSDSEEDGSPLEQGELTLVDKPERIPTPEMSSESEEEDEIQPKKLKSRRRKKESDSRIEFDSGSEDELSSVAEEDDDHVIRSMISDEEDDDQDLEEIRRKSLISIKKAKARQRRKPAKKKKAPLSQAKCLVDPQAPQKNVHVLANGDESFYTVLLSSEFILKHDSKNHFVVFERWGRSDLDSSQNISRSFTDESEAKSFFSLRYQKRTGTVWESTESHERKVGQYCVSTEYQRVSSDESQVFPLEQFLELVCGEQSFEESMEAICTGLDIECDDFTMDQITTALSIIDCDDDLDTIRHILSESASTGTDLDTTAETISSKFVHLSLLKTFGKFDGSLIEFQDKLQMYMSPLDSSGSFTSKLNGMVSVTEYPNTKILQMYSFKRSDQLQTCPNSQLAWLPLDFCDFLSVCSRNEDYFSNLVSRLGTTFGSHQLLTLFQTISEIRELKSLTVDNEDKLCSLGIICEVPLNCMVQELDEYEELPEDAAVIALNETENGMDSMKIQECEGHVFYTYKENTDSKCEKRFGIRDWFQFVPRYVVLLSVQE